MHYLKLGVVSLFVIFLVSCSSVDRRKIAAVLPGTNTAVVGISLDKNGMPKEQFSEVVLAPGQKVLFAGPDEFTIIFKDKKTPNRKIENPSSSNVVVIQIPNGILEQREFAEEFRRAGEVRFRYGIRVKDKELDPTIVIKRL